jgi:phosphoribosylpyrophosphate synthetase
MKFNQIIKKKSLEYCPYPVSNGIKEAIQTAKNMVEALIDVYGSQQRFRLVCAGSSGAILSALAASILAGSVVEIIHIKKDGEKSHCEGDQAEDYIDTVTVIIDDLISSGDTVCRIYKKFTEANPEHKIDAIIVNMRVEMHRLAERCSDIIIDKLICNQTI